MRGTPIARTMGRIRKKMVTEYKSVSGLADGERPGNAEAELHPGVEENGRVFKAIPTDSLPHLAVSSALPETPAGKRQFPA